MSCYVLSYRRALLEASNFFNGELANLILEDRNQCQRKDKTFHQKKKKDKIRLDLANLYSINH